jgi:two-component system, LytTR family, response regulator
MLQTTTAIITDDELHSRAVLRLLLEMHCPQVRVIAEYENADDLALALEKQQPHIVFLDIEMPGTNVFDMLGGLKKIDFAVIFTTAFDHYAIKAIKFNALDYLMKPVDADELQASVEKAVKRPAPPDKKQIAGVQNQMTGNASDFRLSVPTAEGHYFIQPEDLYYCEGQSNYTKLYLTRGRTVLCAKTLKEFEDALQSHGFMRVHKSILANLRYVDKLLPGKYIAVLHNGTQIEVSRRKKDELFNALFNK